MLKVFTSQGPVSADTLSGLLAKVRAVLSRGQATERSDPSNQCLESRQPDGTCERCCQIARDWPGASLDTLHRSHGRVETLEAYADQQARGRAVGLVGAQKGGGKSAWLSDDARRRRLERHLVSQGFSTDRARSLAGENGGWLSYYLGTCGIGAAGLPQEPAWFRTEGGRPLAPVAYDERHRDCIYWFDTNNPARNGWVKKGQHMTRNTVTIDGIQLTRAQVETALAELNKPAGLSPANFPSGTVIRYLGGKDRYLVVSSHCRSLLKDIREHEVCAIGLIDGSLYCFPAERCFIHAVDRIPK